MISDGFGAIVRALTGLGFDVVYVCFVCHSSHPVLRPHSFNPLSFFVDIVPKRGPLIIEAVPNCILSCVDQPHDLPWIDSLKAQMVPTLFI